MNYADRCLERFWDEATNEALLLDTAPTLAWLVRTVEELRYYPDAFDLPNPLPRELEIGLRIAARERYEELVAELGR
jgi:hypothetical protein